MSSSNKRVQGTVKWFSNTKGYGFITPEHAAAEAEESTTEDIFVHQTELDCGDAYRSLTPGWIVEFEVTTDDKGKAKAIHVTAPGGGPCTGPRRPRQRNRSSTKGQSSSSATGEPTEQQSAGTTTTSSTRPPLWHASLDASVQDAMDRKSIRMKTATVDVSFDKYRIKLGSGGYASMAHADGIIAEGTFSANNDGTVTFEWQRALVYDTTDSTWKPRNDDDTETLITSLSLLDDSVGPVQLDETTVTLWGDDKSDPARDVLQANGFQMRQVVLTRPQRRGGGGPSSSSSRRAASSSSDKS